MQRMLIFIYGLLAYLLFFATILYAIGFVENYATPTSLDTGEAGPLGIALAVNIGILLLFAVQHTIMARPAFKAWWTRIIPEAAERSTFVVLASAILCLLFWLWRPIPGVLWDVQTPALRGLLYAISLLGFGIVFYASFLIDHFDLFGVRQVYLNLKQRPYHHHPFTVRSLYRFVRHPLMFGFLLAFWFAPTMTWGHLLFAAVTTVYILFGIYVEERDLVRFHGQAYLEYRKHTPALIPHPAHSSPPTIEPQAHP
ncbi:isoprenylcysteine carboxylmethyltransferase family protein [Planctomycetales bacterium ZRK34]|nr:isoprenylcysteine carboxylmethyltransferase family protein [Planctomycetales bacterium ZRK34]